MIEGPSDWANSTYAHQSLEADCSVELPKYFYAAYPLAVGETALNCGHEIGVGTGVLSGFKRRGGNVGSDNEALRIALGEEGYFPAAQRAVAVEEDLNCLATPRSLLSSFRFHGFRLVLACCEVNKKWPTWAFCMLQVFRY